MEMLTDMDRLRLIAALGRSVLTAGEINPESLGLLLKLSAPNTRLWIQKAVSRPRAAAEIRPELCDRKIGGADSG